MSCLRTVTVDPQRGYSSEAAFMTAELFILKTGNRQVEDKMSSPTSETHNNLELCIHAGGNAHVIYVFSIP